MKKILLVETVDRLMPMFIKLINEYFGSCTVYIVKISSDFFEISEFDSKDVIRGGKLCSITKEVISMDIDYLCIDNYISFKNLSVVKNIKNIERVIFQIGVYINSDVVGYASIRFGSTILPFVILESIIFKIKHIYWAFKLLLFESVENFFYNGAIVIFWNQFSEDNFKNNHLKVKTMNIKLYENAKQIMISNDRKLIVRRIIFAPSLLGSKRQKNDEMEFLFWENMAKVLLISHPEIQSSLSIHPMYRDKLPFFIDLNRNSNSFVEIFCGFTLDENNYDLLITDVSTLFWLAPIYGLNAERVNNFFLHNKYLSGN